MNLIRAAVSTVLFPVVGVRDAQAATIFQVPDIGAHGMQVPQVNSYQVARKIVGTITDVQKKVKKWQEAGIQYLTY